MTVTSHESGLDTRAVFCGVLVRVSVLFCVFAGVSLFPEAGG